MLGQALFALSVGRPDRNRLDQSTQSRLRCARSRYLIFADGKPRCSFEMDVLTLPSARRERILRNRDQQFADLSCAGFRCPQDRSDCSTFVSSEVRGANDLGGHTGALCTRRQLSRRDSRESARLAIRRPPCSRHSCASGRRIRVPAQRHECEGSLIFRSTASSLPARRSCQFSIEHDRNMR